MNRDQTLQILKNNGFLPESRFGQNFLCDEGIIEDIVELCEIEPGSRVLEIGPGIGALTRRIACIPDIHFTAVEIDKRLASYLASLDELSNVEIVSSDYLKYFPDCSEFPITHIVSNIPYYVMTPILKKLFSDCPDFQKMTFMVEDDALDRILAKPGTKQYGPLAVLMNAFGKVRREFSVDRHCFVPEPHTLSAVITLTRDGDYVIPSGFGDFIDACFSMRRKKLTNSLKNYLSSYNLEGKSLVDALNTIGYDSDVRAENISPSEYLKMFNLISEDN